MNEWNEYNRLKEDKLKNGKQLKNETNFTYWNMSQVFLLWWGSDMDKKEVVYFS